MEFSTAQNVPKLREECGVFGIVRHPTDLFSPAFEAYTALFAIQHRGQAACGITVNDDGVFNMHKNTGLVTDVFSPAILDKLQGSAAIGHVRTATSDSQTRVDAQPITVTHVKGNLSVAHNGNIVNAPELRREIELAGGIFHSNSDCEVITYLIVRERLKSSSIELAVKAAMKRLQGAYSMVIMSPRKLIAVRDPSGFRPLVLGKLGESYCFASETCAFDTIGAKVIRDVAPGEIIIIENNELRSIPAENPVPMGLCVFEYVYLARPDSIIDGVLVEQARQDLGRALAEEMPVDADMVCGVPDSGVSAAIGYSKQSGIPFGAGLMKNRYVARTFIQPTQKERENAVRLKLNPLSANVKGKRIILTDDSIVRGTTSAKLVSMLRDAGALEVHMRIASPPFKHPCYFGTDVSNRDVLIAHKHSTEEIAAIIGVDSLAYLSVDKVNTIAKDYGIGVCTGCFTGEYPIQVEDFGEGSIYEKKIEKA